MSNIYAKSFREFKCDCPVPLGCAVIIWGAMTPMVNTLLIQIFNNKTAPSYYLMLAAITSLIALCLIEKKNRENNI